MHILQAVGKLATLVWLQPAERKTVIARCLLVASGLTTLAGMLLLALSWSMFDSYGWGFPGFRAVFAVSFALAGFVLASRRPRIAVGWLLSAIGLLSAVQVCAEGYATYALLANRGILPAGQVAAWLLAWLWLPMMTIVAVWLPLVFPDGRLLSARWRSVAWTAGLGAALGSGALAIAPGPIVNLPSVRNPLGLNGSDDSVTLAIGLGMALLVACAAAAALSLGLRFRRAHRAERQQLKWLASAAALVAVAFPFGIAGTQVLDIKLGQLVLIAAIVTIPVATGIAVLRYRLYDIDLIIRRTLVYAVLTLGLALIYWCGVFVLQQVLRSLTQGSELAIVGSTLAVAALFQPLRHRIQQGVDRRFYRQRYDATRTLEAFSSRLRNEVDLDALGVELLGVVRQTMQPEHLSLWLRPRNRRPF